MLVIGVLSNFPVYHSLQPQQALLRLAFSHSGRPIRECHRLTQQELNALAPNMRKPVDCPRQRLPLHVVFKLDDKFMYKQFIPAAGIWGDGRATVYERFKVPAGQHQLMIGMSDSERENGFDYRLEKQLDIRAGQNLVIGFNPGLKRFVIH